MPFSARFLFIVASVIMATAPVHAADINKQVVVNPDGTISVNKSITGLDGTVNKNVVIGAPPTRLGAPPSNQQIPPNAPGAAALRASGDAIRNSFGTLQAPAGANVNVNKNVTIDPGAYNGGGVVINKSATVTSTTNARPEAVINKSATINTNASSTTAIKANKTVTTVPGQATINKNVVIAPGAPAVPAVNIQKTVTGLAPAAPAAAAAAGVSVNADGSVNVPASLLTTYGSNDPQFLLLVSQLPKNGDGTVTVPAALVSQYGIGRPTAVQKNVTIGNGGGLLNIQKNVTVGR